MKLVDIRGNQFGRLLVLKQAKRRRNGLVCWICRCSCGKIVVTRGAQLRDGHVRSCGCARTETCREMIRKVNLRHGFSWIPEYPRWCEAKKRCFDPENGSYARYGGRGIKMCKRWKNNFIAFYVDMGPCPLGLTLERIDNDGNYEPKNCKWATVAEQNRNTRQNVWVELNGESMILTDAMAKLGISYKVIRRKIDHGELSLAFS